MARTPLAAFFNIPVLDVAFRVSILGIGLQADMIVLGICGEP